MPGWSSTAVGLATGPRRSPQCTLSPGNGLVLPRPRLWHPSPPPAQVSAAPLLSRRGMGRLVPLSSYIGVPGEKEGQRPAHRLVQPENSADAAGSGTAGRTVPDAPLASDEDVERFANFLRRFHPDTGQRLTMLTGAGVSTESGLADYRSPDVGLLNRTDHRPVQYLDFVKHLSTRQRYWCRSFHGFRTFRDKRPNVVHGFLADLERRLCRVDKVITQNVDGLHGKAGSRRVVELHGDNHQCVCMQCGARCARETVQKQLLARNPDFRAAEVAFDAPDGDAALADADYSSFVVPRCASCGEGELKPAVVFFQESVPRAVVDECYAAVDSADSLLVLGSSLTVYSGFRFVKRAVAAGKPVWIVNYGPTRGDPLATVKIEALLSDLARRTWAQLQPSAPAPA